MYHEQMQHEYHLMQLHKLTLREQEHKAEHHRLAEEAKRYANIRRALRW